MVLEATDEPSLLYRCSVLGDKVHTSPEVVPPTAFNDQGHFSVNVQRPVANYFKVDGVSANFGVTGYFPLVQAAGGAFAPTTVGFHSP